MTYRTLFLSLGITILFVQLVTLDGRLSINLPYLSHGDYSIAQIKEKVARNMAPIIYETSYTAFSEKEYDSVVFVGDVMLARNLEELMKREGTLYPFSGLSLGTLAPNPAVIGNFEASMAVSHTATPVNQLKFSVNPLLASSVKLAGFTHMSLANNHSYDYDVEGFKNTKEQLANLGISTFGSEYSVDKSSVRYIKTTAAIIAIIGLNNSDGNLDVNEALKEIELATRKSDLQIIYIHWGIEYDKKHHSSQTKLAKNLIGKGADLIIGHHPHVVQDVDIIDGVPVFYSLGNYIFDQYFAPNVQEGLVLVLDFTAQPKINIIPVSSIKIQSQPSIMPPEEYKKFLLELASISAPELNTNIANGSIPLFSEVATSTKMAIIN